MDAQEGVTEVFARSRKLVRSPQLTGTVYGDNTQQQTTPKGQGTGAGSNTAMFTQTSIAQLFGGNKTKQTAEQGQGAGLGQTPDTSDTSGKKVVYKNKLEGIHDKLVKLIEFMTPKINVHKEIKTRVADILSDVIVVKSEYETLTKRAVSAEETLAKTLLAVAIPSLTGPVVPRTEKRNRESPGVSENTKKQKDDQDGDNEAVSEARSKEKGEASNWRTIQKQQERKEKWRKKKEERLKQKTEERPKEGGEAAKTKRSRPLGPRSKGDALVVKVQDGTSYADVLRKLKSDPDLKELGENVVKTRRTQTGDMLFELKKNPEVKSSAFTEIVKKSLGGDAEVRAMTQEVTVEARNLDDDTTESDVKAMLTKPEFLGEVPMSIRLRKAYGCTQAGTIRLSLAAANQLVRIGKIKIGWAVVTFRAPPRETKEMVKCFRCWDFGHLSRNCSGPDRTKTCWKCGKEGHIAKDCMRQPRCVLCAEQDGNDHSTGGYRCPMYQKAKAGLL